MILTSAWRKTLITLIGAVLPIAASPALQMGCLGKRGRAAGLRAEAFGFRVWGRRSRHEGQGLGSCLNGFWFRDWRWEVKVCRCRGGCSGFPVRVGPGPERLNLFGFGIGIMFC